MKDVHQGVTRRPHLRRRSSWSILPCRRPSARPFASCSRMPSTSRWVSPIRPGPTHTSRPVRPAASSNGARARCRDGRAAAHVRRAATHRRADPAGPWATPRSGSGARRGRAGTRSRPRRRRRRDALVDGTERDGRAIAHRGDDGRDQQRLPERVGKRVRDRIPGRHRRAHLPRPGRRRAVRKRRPRRRPRRLRPVLRRAHPRRRRGRRRHRAHRSAGRARR